MHITFWQYLLVCMYMIFDNCLLVCM